MDPTTLAISPPSLLIINVVGTPLSKNFFANLTQSSQNCDKYTHLERLTQIPGL